MNKLTKLWKSHPVLLGGLIFGAASLVLNLLSIFYLDMAHVYDIVHIFPVVGLLSVLPSEPNTQFALLPLALVVDILVGFLVGFLFRKRVQTGGGCLLAVLLAFAVYFIAICYQWIPII